MAVRLQKQKGIDSSMNGALALNRRREWPKAVGMNRLISNGRWKKAANPHRTGDLFFATSSQLRQRQTIDGRHQTGVMSLLECICHPLKRPGSERSLSAWIHRVRLASRN